MNPLMPQPVINPSELMTKIVSQLLATIYEIEQERAIKVHTLLVKTTSTLRFHMLKTQSQFASVWADLRADDDTVDLVLSALHRFRFEITTTVEGYRPNKYDEVIENLVDSFTVIDANQISLTAIDDVLLDRLCDSDSFPDLIKANQWCLVLMLLSFSPKVLGLLPK